MTTYSVPVYRLKLVRERTQRYALKSCQRDDHAAAIVAALIGDRDCEHIVVIFLNASNDVVGSTIAAIGGRTECSVALRDILKAALVANATSIVIGHNHPSGDPKPSEKDRVFTKRLAQLAADMGVPLLDHVIVTHTGAQFSFMTHGLLP
jgi:DNA repair protein RadC